MKTKKILIALLGLAVAGGFAAAFATAGRADGAEELSRILGPRGQAESAVAARIAAKDLKDDPDVIRITPDSSKIIRLEQDAASVIVANPAHAEVILDSPRLLVVMPRQPGVTSFTVLNAKGETLAQKRVIVTTAAEQKYVRVRKSCRGNDSSCVPEAYYYCPDSCYPVQALPPGDGNVNIPPLVGGAQPGIDSGDAGNPGEPSRARTQRENKLTDTHEKAAQDMVDSPRQTNEAILNATPAVPGGAQ
jgi:Pilus formation protein N terminal region